MTRSARSTLAPASDSSPVYSRHVVALWSSSPVGTCNHRSIYQSPACIYNTGKRSINRRHVYTQQTASITYRGDATLIFKGGSGSLYCTPTFSFLVDPNWGWCWRELPFVDRLRGDDVDGGTGSGTARSRFPRLDFDFRAAMAVAAIAARRDDSRPSSLARADCGSDVPDPDPDSLVA